MGEKAVLKMELPESCMECQLRNWEYRLQAHLCKAIKPFPHNIVDNYITGGNRPPFCPLEIESETGCEKCSDLNRYKSITGILTCQTAADDIYETEFKADYCPKCGRELRERVKNGR